jgi:O-antigen biosynthesis protein
VLRLRQDLGVPLDISIHDYFFVCRRVTLTDVDGRYCGEGRGGCGACTEWPAQYAPLLDAADRVIAPSLDAANRIRQYFPNAKVVAAAHRSKVPPEARRVQILGPETPLTIGVLGAMTTHKGLHRLRECVESGGRRQLPLRFVLVGYVEGGAGKEAFPETGPYNNDTLPGLLRKNEIDVIWFPAQWPETFSYTLSAAMEAGYPVIAPDLGAFTERLAERAWSWIVPWNLPTDELLEFFVRVRQEHFIPDVSPPGQRGTGTPAAGDFYPEGYLARPDGYLTGKRGN